LAGLQTVNPELHERRRSTGPPDGSASADHVAASPAGHDGGDALLGHPDLRGLSARLRAHRRRARQRDAPVRHLRVPDRINTGLLGEGAAVSLAMFPMLFLIVVIQLWYIRRVEGA